MVGNTLLDRAVAVPLCPHSANVWPVIVVDRFLIRLGEVQRGGCSICITSAVHARLLRVGVGRASNDHERERCGYRHPDDASHLIPPIHAEKPMHTCLILFTTLREVMGEVTSLKAGRHRLRQQADPVPSHTRQTPRLRAGARRHHRRAPRRAPDRLPATPRSLERLGPQTRRAGSAWSPSCRSSWDIGHPSAMIANALPSAFTSGPASSKENSSSRPAHRTRPGAPRRLEPTAARRLPLAQNSRPAPLLPRAQTATRHPRRVTGQGDRPQPAERGVS